MHSKIRQMPEENRPSINAVHQLAEEKSIATGYKREKYMTENFKKNTPAQWRIITLVLVFSAGLLTAGCAGRVDTHGHVFTAEDIQQVQVGMGVDQVLNALGTPDTRSGFANEIFYYMSTKKRTVSLFKPKTIDRKVLAVYFDRNKRVKRIANYGMKDGKVFDFVSRTTPSHGGDTSLIQQLLGNLGKKNI